MLSFKVKILSIHLTNVLKDRVIWSLNRPALKHQDMATELSVSDSLPVRTLVKLHLFYYLRLDNFFILQVSCWGENCSLTLLLCS